MKNLHKKVSVIVLGWALLLGSFLSNELIVHDSSNQFIGRYQGEFIGESKQFLGVYYELMKKVSKEEIEHNGQR